MALGLVGLTLSVALHAQTRYFRLLGADDGLPAPSINGLAQDQRGFMWFGTAAGLFRYDGAEMRRYFAPPRDVIYEIASTDEGIAVRLESGAVTLVGENGAAALPDPAGNPIASVRDICPGGDGALWVLLESGDVLRRAGGSWSAIASPWLAAQPPRRLHPTRDGALAVTVRGLWRLRAGESLHLVDFDRPYAAVEHPAGGWWLLSNNGKVWRWQGGEPELRFASDARSVDIVRRGDWAWIATDRYLAALDAEGVVEARLGSGELPGGGPLLVDDEGSLWLGTHQGAVILPEPESATFGEAQGFPTPSVRALDLYDGALWVTNWGSTGIIRRGKDGWRGAPEPGARGRFCRDPAGGLWSGVPGQGIVRRAENGTWRRAVPGDWSSRPGLLDGCVIDQRGATWMSSGGGLWRLDPGSTTLQPVAAPSPEEEFSVMLVDRAGRLWLDRGEWWGKPRVDDHARLCSAAIGELSGSAQPAAWSCLDVPGAVTMETVLEVPSGSLWAASKRLGVVEIRAGGARVLQGSMELPSHNILGLAPAAGGGVWIVGHGVIERVSEDPASPAGWRVEERVTSWHGVSAGGAGDAIEDADGAIWIATSRGVARVPRNARQARSRPPRVELVEAGSAAGPLELGAEPRLPQQAGLRLRFAALSFRDPSLVRYQTRLGDGPWSEASPRASLEFPRLGAGSYRVQARASLDGREWTATPAGYSFRILPPWYRTRWALALGVALLAGLVWAAHRARVGVLLALERQRTRVAMDLHDEMGSGLGSIGILSSLMAQRELDAGEQQRLAREIAATSQELGGSLSDIVWALRSEGATLESLAARLAESGGRLFAGNSTAFSSRFPEAWPQRPLSLPLRRNVLLAGLEALHNAARHAHASRVELSLAPRGGGWELAVEDDGVGLPPEVERKARGMGLSSMRKRAAEIGGAVEWRRPAPGGTRVALTFRLP